MAAQKLIIHVRSATAQREIPVEMVSEGLAAAVVLVQSLLQCLLHKLAWKQIREPGNI